MAHVHHRSPQERRKRLNLWLIFVVVLVLIAVAALGLVLLLDGDEKGGGSNVTTTSTTTAAATPEQYAQATYAAWKANDRAGATQYASLEAIEELFSVPYTPAQTPDGPQDPLTFVGCEGAAGSVICTWTGQLEQLVMTVRNTTGGLPVLVVQVQRKGG